MCIVLKKIVTDNWHQEGYNDIEVVMGRDEELKEVMNLTCGV